MRIAIFSDIHSNIEALSVFREDVKQQGVDKMICLGDVIGYGANPNECCEIVRDLAEVTLLGNHDTATLGLMSTEYYYESAQLAIDWTRSELKRENLEWLASCPYSTVVPEADAGFFHGAPFLPSNFYYVITNQHAQTLGSQDFFEKLRNVTFIGHAHMTRMFEFSADKAVEFHGDHLPNGGEANGSKFVINVGSVGQPRDRDPRGCYVVFDSEKRSVEFRRFEYDIKTAANKIMATPLDPEFGKRLYEGR
jgi:diadenosine tetraphosphatase ApaH/serine/threonine PP2A family protein phosphatase